MNVVLFTGMTHAQAAKVCSEIGAQVKQDGRGGMRLEFQQCPTCTTTMCAEFEICAAQPTAPEAA